MTALFTYLGWTWVLAVLGTTAVALVLDASRMWRPGVSYTFGSIYNTVVNPRFGGGVLA